MEVIESTEKKFSLTKFIVSIIALAIIGAIIGITRFENYYKDIEYDIWVFISDILSLTGFIGCLLWLLVFASSEGAFDGLAFATKKAFNALFRKDVLNSMPRTYKEYLDEKNSRRKPAGFELLIVSGSILVIGIILLIICL